MCFGRATSLASANRKVSARVGSSILTLPANKVHPVPDPIPIEPDLPSALRDVLAQACDLVEQSRFKQAAVYIKKAVNSDPQDVEGLVAMAGVFRKLGRHSEALIVLDTLLEYHPANSILLDLKASIQKELNKKP